MATSNHFDFLIVGHGIAGTLLGYFLENRGQRCLYLDASEQTSASSVAAGIINPITGRRFVKSWRVADLLPEAKRVYQQLEAELGISIYHQLPLIRTLFNRGDENNWQARLLEPEFAPYAQEPPVLGGIPEITQAAFSYFQVAQTAKVDIGTLCATLREQHLLVGRLLETELNYPELLLIENGVQYGAYTANQVVFCEGWRARHNPWFQHLPHGGNKGEVLEVSIPGAELQRMFKHRVFLVPQLNGNYWIGATSENQFDSEVPTPGNAEFLEARLLEILTVPFEVIAHRAAIRPTVKDRRPMLGRHPQHPQLAIFNGLGTKGASLAPFWAQHLVSHLLDGTSLDSIVDIQRF